MWTTIMPSSTSVARSSLEEMLDSIRQRDERKRDSPPTLPVRPVSKARLPSSRRLKCNSFKSEEHLQSQPSEDEGKKRDLQLSKEETKLEEEGKKRDLQLSKEEVRSGLEVGGCTRKLAKVVTVCPRDLQLGKEVTKLEEGNKRDVQLSKEETESGLRVGGFSARKMAKVDIVRPSESPYASKVEKVKCGKRLEERNDVDFVDAPSSLSFEESECHKNIQHVLKKNLRVWCQLPNGMWESGKIQSSSEEDAHIFLSDGRVVTIPMVNVLPANPNILEGVDDLIQLSYMNEPSVLHNLQFRYFHNMIYTKAGPVLIAVNPFKKVQVYGNDYVTAYKQKLMDSPHVYAIADNAFNEMMRNEVNQSIIISGESGAGKTETAKIAMQYLAALGGSDGIEHEILHTSCILEAFGNAKTSRNDNSSRFGKLIEIHFSSVGKICGAKIQTFLLEKSRVVQLAKGERSYHVFYQLCSGAPSYLKEKLNLKRASEYSYLKQSDCLSIDDVDDAQGFHMLMEALDVVQLCKEDQESMFAMLAAVLWLGNISFEVIDNENHVEVVSDEAVINAANLMGCNVEDLMAALSSRRIRAGNDNIIQKLTLPQAIDSRDALAKSIYSSLFEWLVEQINKSLEVNKRRTGRSISILDIYGFESFKKNSFEQFCINYANERLQQHFNRHLFKLEQEEYAQDGIDWTKVDFEDNQECLSLFEKKPLGLLSLLDEESTFPKATDLTFANKLKQHLSTNPCFKGERGGAFGIHHYAGEVVYDTSGFLEKNRDPLHSDSIQLFSTCRCQLLQLFASNMLNPSQKPASPSWRQGATDCQKQSVGTKFKGQLFQLMQRLGNTTPHFIRCIKPNSKQLPGTYENDLVLQQLRCCGVLEVVRISKSGYPTRLTHQQFARRYGFLLSESVVPQDPLSISVAILQQFNVHPEMYQVGYTKLFFRTGQIAALEDARKRMLQGTLIVQKCFRGYQARCYFHELKGKITMLQSLVRYENARKQYQLLIKKQRAVFLVQRHLRQKIARRAFNDQRMAVIQMQSVIRGWLVRRNTHKLQYQEESKSDNRKALTYVDLKVPKLMDFEEHVQVQSSVLAELQRRVLVAESALAQKEAENSLLSQKLKQYETRWSEYEAKMKSMEEMWQKQMTSLQVSLVAAKKSLASDDPASQPGKPDVSPKSDDTPSRPGKRDVSPRSHYYYDSEDTMSVGGRTPGGSTPVRPFIRRSDAAAGRDSQAGLNAVSNLLKEFEQRKQVFSDDAMVLIEVGSAQTEPTWSADDELRKLKARFQAWKKEYKVRLRETRANLQKFGWSETGRGHKKWWGKRITRVV